MIELWVAHGTGPMASSVTRCPHDPRPATAVHRHVLIVDDNQRIHDDFRKVLNPNGNSDALSEAETSLFGEESTSHRAPTRPEATFHVDSALSGEVAVDLVERHAARGHRYSVAFVDVRMPPGWNGLKTTQEIWRRDPDVQIVLCTAYSDCSWDTMVEELGAGDNFLILKKPFDVIEARQIAQALSEKWRALRDNEKHLEGLEAKVRQRTNELEKTCAELEREMEERAALEVELRRAHKLEAVGRLAAGLGHEINNPLSYMLCNLEHVAEQLQRMLSDDAGTELACLIPPLEDAALGAKRIKQIVETTREFARPVEGELCAVDVGDVIGSSRRMLNHELAHLATVREDLAETARVAADPRRLEQVIVNLLTNAAQACDDHDAKPEIHIWTAAGAPGEVVIGVRDSGRGISKENLERIFDPFFSTRPKRGGTGLGLWISRDIVRSFGGRLELQSEVGRGTTAQVILQVAADGLPEAEPVESETTARRHSLPGRGRVLLVDDEPAVLRGLKRRLSRHDVTTASNVDDAVRTYQNGTFDIVFCDLMMPGADGLDFHRRLHEMGSEHSGRVVMMTGGVFSDRLRSQLAKLDNHCLRKPFDENELEDLIAAAIDPPRESLAV